MGREPGAGGMVVLAVDDEQPVLDELAHLLAADDNVAAVVTASDAAQALRILAGHARPVTGGGTDGAAAGVDAVFCDIGLPGLDGLELARACARLAAPPAVVFVTARDDRAVDAFDVGAVDYLLKPIRAERLGSSLARIRAGRDPSGGTAAEPEDVIPVDLAGTTTLVARSQVCWVEAHGDYVRLHTTGGASHLVRLPLGTLEERWRDAGFLRVHRRFLVATAHVSALRTAGTGLVVRVGGVEVPVSRRLAAEVRRRVRGG